MLLGVECGGGELYIADVGFGGLTLTGPLRLMADIEQSTPHETFRLAATGRDGFVLEVLLRGAWKPIYSFDRQPQVLADYQMSNWYLCNFPESPFLQNLMAARVTPDRRYALLNNRLTTYHRCGESEQITLTSPGDLREVLEGVLQIVLPEDPGLEAVLERFSTDKLR